MKIAGNRYLKFLAYLNLLSQEAPKGNDSVNNKRYKYSVILCWVKVCSHKDHKFFGV